MLARVCARVALWMMGSGTDLTGAITEIHNPRRAPALTGMEWKSRREICMCRWRFNFKRGEGPKIEETYYTQ